VIEKSLAHMSGAPLSALQNDGFQCLSRRRKAPEKSVHSAFVCVNKKPWGKYIKYAWIWPSWAFTRM
jgi:hypothetical protein